MHNNASEYLTEVLNLIATVLLTTSETLATVWHPRNPKLKLLEKELFVLRCQIMEFSSTFDQIRTVS